MSVGSHSTTMSFQGGSPHLEFLEHECNPPSPPRGEVRARKVRGKEVGRTVVVPYALCSPPLASVIY